MAASIERVKHGAAMKVVRQADIRRVGPDLGEHRLPVGVQRAVRESGLGLEAFQGPGRDVASGDNFRLRDLLQRIDVFADDGAAGDKGDFQFAIRCHGSDSFCFRPIR
ncbi:hypothetical protein SDC9_182703 [bioreactor metagenome]|uniref:Uncharacterized protein n=1 Tax=bioreactor metagenome TaxID=1076179 RepID=A0A645H9L1_9ZZZZ